MGLYRWLLRLCAPSLHREYGAAMAETFERRVADARVTGLGPALRVALREVFALFALAVADRWGQRRGLKPSPSGGFVEGRGFSPGRRMRIDRRGKAGRMDGMGLEIRQAARRLLRAPAFTVATVLTLALAIGANASIFAVVQHVIVNPLPYPDSDRLIELDHGAAKLKVTNGMGLTNGLYFQYAERARSLESVAIYQSGDLTVTGDGVPERIRATRATTSLAKVMRLSPSVGRWFSEAEGKPGAPAVGLISHGLWSRRYGSSPGVIGRSITVAGVPTEIIGVMPASFAFPEARVDLWIPEPAAREKGFGLFGYAGVARMREGVALASVRTELDALIGDLPAAFPGDAMAAGNGRSINLTFTGRTLKDATVGSIARALWILLASVGLLLLVACANVANLFLVRSDSRQREVAVRRALGAGGFGMARYFLTESALLSIAGGVVGFAIAWAAVRMLVTLGPATLPRLGEVQLDGVSIAFTFLLTAFTAIAFGTIPLWRVAPLANSLHESGRGNTASRGRYHARQLMMGAQVALALVLLVSSGLLVRSFLNLRALDPGFNPSSTLTFSLGLPATDYPNLSTVVAAHQAIIDRLAALPGVTAASAGSCLPLAGGCSGNTIQIEGHDLAPGEIPPLALFRAVAGGYFEAMGMRLIRGRFIDRGDVDRREPVVVISETIAKKYFANQDPIGMHLASNRPAPRDGSPRFAWLTVVGIVADTPVRVLAEPSPLPQLYMPMSIGNGPGPTATIGPNVAVMSYVVRTTTTPGAIAPSVRAAIDGIDRNLALAQVRTLQEIVDRASSQMAFTMVLLAIAAGVALMLGVIGIYGVMSYIVSQRTGEIGVRLALGAEPVGVARGILREGGVVAVIGIAAGMSITLAGARLIESLLYGISPRDPAVFVTTTIALLAVALLACWLPARRAARLSPLEALRTD
jgi:putative ABC transport system permease protein